jgi:hypothetical protein
MGIHSGSMGVQAELGSQFRTRFGERSGVSAWAVSLQPDVPMCRYPTTAFTLRHAERPMARFSNGPVVGTLGIPRRNLPRAD